ncbi:serine/threonine-protein kinase [Roseburia sp. AM59-24XD]|jgi:serine/threonine protein kinase|uniref:serine/threonine-protein kinase n=1 Tax=Roseburia sp. AM59-24XD TaxID=2293138 RepID=UPI000E4F8820|nr:serine/threonine-protein kinase [Roseburia sp. AM59-24XD]RHP85745.1 serine/threonine protein kinase [Roseburia sp. AM59-24XD]
MDVIHQIWPNWTTVNEIGEGAFGKVYKVKREDLGNVSYSAVKVMHIPKDNSEINDLYHSGMDFDSIHTYFEDMVQNLLNEIQIMESLKSATNIVAIEDYQVVNRKDEISWDIYIRMELVQDLGSFLAEKGMTRQQILRLGMDMCQALIACERANVIHRDIKVDNVFFNGFDSFKLGDFGISKQLEKTQSALSQKGTNMYMAPEVFRAEKYDHTVDIYSLGIMLYRLLNRGRFPFQPPADKQMFANDSQKAMAQRLGNAPMPAPAMADEQLSAIILKACAYQAKDRYQSARDMLAALTEYQQTVRYDGSEMVLAKMEPRGKVVNRSGNLSGQNNSTVAAFQGKTCDSKNLSQSQSGRLTPPVGGDIGEMEEDKHGEGKRAGLGRKPVMIAGIAFLTVILGVAGFLTVRYLTRDTSGLAKQYTTVDKLQISARMPKGWEVTVDEDKAVATYKKGKVSKSISFSMDFDNAALESGEENSVRLQSVKDIIKEKDNGLAPDGASEKYAHTRLTSTAWKMAALGGGNLEDAIEESRLYTINGRNYYYLQSYTKYGEYKADSAYYYTVQDAAEIYFLFNVVGTKMTKADKKLFDAVMGSVRMNTEGIKYYTLTKKKVDPYALADKSTSLKGGALSVTMPKEYQITENDNGIVGTYKDSLVGINEVSVTLEEEDWIGDFADGMNDAIAQKLLEQMLAQGKTINHKEHVLVGSRACYAVGSSDSTGRSFTYYSVYQGKLLAFTYKVSGSDAGSTISDSAKEMLRTMITGAGYQ